MAMGLAFSWEVNVKIIKKKKKKKRKKAREFWTRGNLLNFADFNYLNLVPVLILL